MGRGGVVFADGLSKRGAEHMDEGLRNQERDLLQDEGVEKVDAQQQLEDKIVVNFNSFVFAKSVELYVRSRKADKRLCTTVWEIEEAVDGRDTIN